MSDRTFSDVVEATTTLSLDEQEALLDLLRRRIAEQNRQQIVQDVAEARQTLQANGPQPTSVDDLISEIES